MCIFLVLLLHSKFTARHILKQGSQFGLTVAVHHMFLCPIWTTSMCVGLCSRSPVDKLSITWRRNGVELASGVGSFGRRLTVVNPTSADVGLYVCEASLLDSSVRSAEAQAYLSIIGKLPVSTCPSSASLQWLSPLCLFFLASFQGDLCCVLSYALGELCSMP